MTNGHARRSPSMLSNIIACPLYGKMIDTHGKNETSSYADEGTMLHDVTSQILDPKNSAESSPDYATLNAEQKSAVDDCVDYCHNVLSAFDDRVNHYDSVLMNLPLDFDIYIEHPTDMSYLDLSECNGTADVLIKCYDANLKLVEVHIIDWKFGAGVKVSPVENAQLKAYALGCFTSIKELLDCDKVVLHVGQPRFDSFESWETNGTALLEWETNELQPAIQLSYQDNAPARPGTDQCRWCVGVACPARSSFANEKAQEVFAKYIDPGDAVKLATDAELAQILDDMFFVESYVKELKKYALSKALSPGGFPGYKVVHGRSSRKWINEDAAIDWLMTKAKTDEYNFTIDDIFETLEPKFRTGPALEKIDKKLKKDPEFQALMHKPPGAPTLVSENDPRKEFKPASAVEVFKDHIN